MRVVAIVLGVLVLVVGYFWVVLSWNYSAGERAGWVQKFSKKGWLCKTWEGEMAMVSMPGTTTEKFFFTVWDDAVAEQHQQGDGQTRVAALRRRRWVCRRRASARRAISSPA